LGVATAAAADTAADSIETVVVTASRFQQGAREQQKNALNIVNIQPYEAIIKYPDFNAAESLSRIPGVSLLSDTGEGRFVNIRGLDGNLNGATYGGIPLLNTNPGGTYNGGGGRAVEFDTIPDGAIDGLIVTKTGTPDHDAEGLGGTVELTPRTATDVTSPFADITAGVGYEPIHGHGGPYNGDVAVGARFGFNKGLVVENGQTAGEVMPGWISNPTPFSFVLDASWREDRRGFDDLEEDYINDPANPAGPLYKVYDDLQLRLYNYHRRRFGYGGEFDFKPNPDHRYYIRANEFGYVESVIKNHLIYNTLGGSADGSYPLTIDPANPNGIATQSDLTLRGTNEQEAHRNGVFAIGGEDDFNPIKIDYHAAFSSATFYVSRDYGSTFDGPQGVFVTYDNITNPNFPSIDIKDGTNPDDPALYTLSKFGNDTERDVDQEWSVAGNATVPLNVLNDADVVKFGFQVRLRNKVQRVFNQDLTGPNGEDISSLGINLATLSPLPPDQGYYDNHYTNGPRINQDSLLGLIRNGTVVAGPMVFDPTAFFHADENIYAGYGMYTGQYGPWGLLAGVRIEATDAAYGFFDVDPDGNPIGFERQPHSYTNVFPTVQLRYEFAQDLIARATYSTGIGRPGFNQLAGAVTIDKSNDTITTGNPDLKPTTGDNFDLDVEYYLNDSGILQFGGFDKEFQDYIFSRTIKVASDPRLPGVSPVFLVSYGNIPSADARGLEATYQQKFTFLGKPFDGLGLEGNITYVTSSGAPRPGEEHALPGTSPITYNVAAFYEAYGLSLRLAGQYVAHSLYQVGGNRAQDQFEDSRFTLDFTSSYDINDRWSAYFNVRNLTNAPLRIYLGAPNWPIQREFYEQTFEVGVRIHL
jgi:TonB-dependent receptor